MPQAEYPEHFESLLATPHGTDLVAMAKGHGVEVIEPETIEEFLGELGTPVGVKVLVITTNREENLALHRKLFDQA